MADVVTLKPGQAPPQNEAVWVIVQRTPSGRHDVAVVQSTSQDITYNYDPSVPGQRESVIAQATALADRRGAPHVYVYAET